MGLKALGPAIYTTTSSAEAEGRVILEPRKHKGALNAKGFRFAIVESRWNELLTSKLTSGAVDALERLGAESDDVEIFTVPGSFELPLTAKKVAATGRFDALICIGVVIRGETPHFDYVAGEAAKGISQVAMTTDVPVLFGIVTADTVEQAVNRCGVKAGNKGFDAAMSAVEIVNLLKGVGSGGEAEDEAAMPHAV